VSFHRGLMRGPLRIFCTECFLKGILARRVYSPVQAAYRCPRCLKSVPAIQLPGRRSR
jgi:hypothetical protein